MAERIPSVIFDNATLTETPQSLVRRPCKKEVIDVYNRVFSRLMARGIVLGQQFRNGRFNALNAVSQRITDGTVTPDDKILVGDYRTLLNARTALYGRRNINIANEVSTINDQQATVIPVTAEQSSLMIHYQSGNFDLINGADRPLVRSIRKSRFVVPVKDPETDKVYAIIDGAPVEGMIKFIDTEIAQTLSDTTLSNRSRRNRLNALRHEMNVLFTQSSPIFEDNNAITHARNQLEAYYNHIDPLKSESKIPDWTNGENLLRKRRVLSIPQEEKGRRRLGCLPFLLPLPLLLPLFLNITTSPCQGTDGNLRVEVFDPSKVSSVSLKGANERELGYHLLGLNQREYRSSDNPLLRAIVDDAYKNIPDLVKEYLSVAEQDEVQTGQRIRADKKPTAWVNGTEFEGERWVLPSCLSPKQRVEKAIENIDRRNNPRWYDGALEFLGRIYQAIPKIDITLR